MTASAGALRVVTVPDAAALARVAAEEVTRRAEDAVATRGRFTVALTGGSTPRALYALLGDPAAPFRARLPWRATHVFFIDERNVPPDHPESNYRMAHQTLLAHVTPASIHRMEGERPAEEAAARYEADLRASLGAGEGGPPPLDLVLLGIGPDGHVASLFPGSPALEERVRWVAGPFVPAVAAHRITLTLPVLDAARAAVFIVEGARKAATVRALLAPDPAEPIPAARVRARTRLLLADRAAAAAEHES